MIKKWGISLQHDIISNGPSLYIQKDTLLKPFEVFSLVYLTTYQLLIGYLISKFDTFLNFWL